jgi:hypothetical protein
VWGIRIRYWPALYDELHGVVGPVPMGYENTRNHGHAAVNAGFAVNQNAFPALDDWKSSLHAAAKDKDGDREKRRINARTMR